MDTVQQTILERIRSAKSGGVFTPKDFLDTGSRHATDQALSRLVRSGNIQRLGRGLYYYPRINPRLKIKLTPDVDQVAQAIGRRTGSRMVPSGAVAANIFGLSTQVPAKFVYLSDGRSRRIRIGKMELQIKHVAPKELPLGSQTSALVFQALRYMGKQAVDPQVVTRLKAVIPAKEKRDLAKDSRYTTDWIAGVVRQIVSHARKPAETVRG
ncbi:MAG TPA: DUF6088 family protein [Phycisphaerae bacterium]|nr:DUF6088 family protein [Phycisphaerae bacterium]